MDADEIRTLLGDNIFERAKKYRKRIQQSTCTVNADGVRHISAMVQGSGGSYYYTQAWLRENGSFVSASCSCPYNQNGEGTYCKHIGALLLDDAEKNAPAPAAKPDAIPGVVRGTAGLGTEPSRRDSYASGLEMLFGKKWHGEAPVSDHEARRLLDTYKEAALEDLGGGEMPQRTGFVRLEPELTLLPGELPWLRLRISADGGRQYVVKSIPDLLRAVEKHGFISYGKALEFQHSWEAFSPEAQQLLRLLRRQLSAKEGAEAALRSYGNAPRSGPAGGIPLNGEIFDGLVALYAPTGNLGGYTLKTGIPALTMRVEKRRGGVEVSVTPALGWKTGLDNDYLYSEDTIWQLDRAESARMRPALEALCGKSLFFTTGDATAFCSYVLPELGSRVTIEDPERLLLNQIPLEPVVQFYLDAPTRETVRAHLEFLYGEDRVTPEEPGPAGLLRDARAEQRAGRLLGRYLEPGPDTMGNGLAAHYDAYEEDEVYRFLDEGVPALLAEGEVYLTDAFRSMQAAPPKISVGVSVHGSVLDLEVDTGEFPVGELKALLKSLHQKKRYHRLRDGRLLRLDDSMAVLDELNETLDLSGAKVGQAHARLPLYRAPSLDWALSGQNGIRFNRDDAFRQLSRSFHAVKDSEYTPPASLQKVLRKYQRDGYRWLRTLDGYGMGGILADDMGLGKTVQVLSYLLALREQGGNPLPSLIVCPASLVLNWAEECQKFTPELNCVVVDGDAAHRAQLAEQWDGADVVVTSYDLLRRDETLYENQKFYACILDEAQAIKNHTTQKYKAVCGVNSRVRFALTGTPVENRLGELWSIFSFLMPGYLPPYKSFCSRFEKPITQENDPAAVRRLNQLTGPFILRRMKSEVLKELPPKTENVYRIELEEEQRKAAQVAALEQKKKELLEKLKELEKQIAEAKAKKNDVMATKNLLDQRNQLLLEQIDDTQNQIDDAAAQIARYELLEEEQYTLFCQQVREEEERGSLSYLSVLFKATSMADLLNRMEFVNEVAEYNKRIISALQETRENIKAEKAEMEAKETQLSEQQDELQGKLDETTKLMNEYAADQKALEQLHDAEAKAADEIDAQLEQLIADSDVVPSNEGFIWPVSTSKKISSPVGSRVAPGGFGSTNHKGVDICNVSYTSSVYAVKSGKVILTNTSGWGGGYGNYVVIDHGGGLTTLYAHLSVVKVSQGQTVSQGTVIGVTGNTGASTGPHLHYEVRTTTVVNGVSKIVYQNPLNYLAGYIKAW